MTKPNILSLSIPAVFVLLLCMPLNSKASHIVGGEMTYRYIPGTDSLYEISLTVYRDCFFGEPDAYFDNPASIGIFDFNGILLKHLKVPLMNDDTLPPMTADPCLRVPGDVCVHITSYRVLTNLTPRPGGYTLAYQRCCRNKTINNIIDPDLTGATYAIQVTELALIERNSSPTITEWPPIFICINKPINFSQGAIDADGDEIRYSLCTPLAGASDPMPRPQPPNNPPFDSVIWQFPYSLDNVLGGDPKLEIDPNTGFVTGVPNVMGQFVVGICVEEFRDGQLISTTRRDFQYNIGECIETTSAFFVPTLQCDNRTVITDNLSMNATSYQWDVINRGGDTIFSAYTFEPEFPFPDTGHYTICLVTLPGQSCADTACQIISIQDSNIEADFSYFVFSCNDSLKVDVTDLSVDIQIFEPEIWDWCILQIIQGDTIIIDSSDLQDPSFILGVDDSLYIKLIVTSTNGCLDDLIAPLDATIIPPGSFPDTLSICRGDSVYLNPNVDSGFDFMWSPGATLDNPNIANPLAGPTETTLYTVTVSDGDSGCGIELDVLVEVFIAFDIVLPEDSVFCGDKAILVGNTNSTAGADVEYIWATDRNFTENVVVGDTVCLEVTDTQMYYVMGVDTMGCYNVDSILLINGEANITLEGNPLTACINDTLYVNALNLIPNQTIQYEWITDLELIRGQGTDIAVFFIDSIGMFEIVLHGINEFGCEDYDTIKIQTFGDLDTLHISYEQDCELPLISFENVSVIADFYTWYFEYPDQNATSSDPVTSHLYPGPGTYTVGLLPDLTNIPCRITDTIFFEIEVLDTLLISDFTWDFINCDSIAEIQFFDDSESWLSDIVSWKWTFSDGQMSTDQNPLIMFPNGPIDVTLEVENGDTCMSSITKTIDFLPIVSNLPDTVILCPNITGVELNPNGNPIYNYTWSPTDGLDLTNPWNPVASPSETTTYNVTITDDAGLCQVEGSVVVCVSPLIGFGSATAIPDTINRTQSTQLGIELRPGVNYVWSPSGGLDPGATVHNPIAFPDATTTFTVTLTDEKGCSDTRAVSVFVRDNLCDFPFVFIPSAFSPNNDGSNDELCVYGETIELVDLVIYNRWGEMVFQATDQSQCWDGKYKGEELPSDVFGYVLNVKCFGEEVEFFKKGNISLLR